MAYGKVFCVECNHLISEENARSVFQTGFYRRGVPLGQCQECMESSTTHHSVTDRYIVKL